ncbi:uncharacterized protein LOC129797498 [Lutzomyia longipalpis]|uniref:Uncharacterized protein n=1 Tax=Lutzomyia longipalpis TaxID=7200 RepID=A0A1B0CRH9_LUTLO|nr:uncharacterized protein LOC129797498 [Lutzomyia longipalpis]
MPEAQPKGKCIELKPLTKYNVCYYYAPLSSMITYAGLSVNVMNPSFVYKFHPNRDVTNYLLYWTLFGSGLYIYGRPHLRALPPKTRASYSIVGSVLFSMGSLLVWAFIRTVVPKNNALHTILGLGSSFVIARLSYDYLDYVDSLVPAK